MQRVSSGYTIIEVMIFLGISAAIAGAAMNLISGKQAETEFNQRMRDTQSKIQDWLNDVSTGNTGADPSQQNCTIQGNRPFIQNSPPPLGYSPSCVFLGKAIQFTDHSYSATQSENLYAYPVFGCRIKSCSPSGPLPTNMIEANSDSPVGQGGEINLVETYSLSSIYVKNVTSVPLGGSHLIGFMNNFNTEQNTAINGSENLNIYEYDFDGTASVGSPQVLHCLQVTGGCPSPSNLTNYIVCFSDGKHTAEIIITSASGVGASTRLDYLAC